MQIETCWSPFLFLLTDYMMAEAIMLPYKEAFCTLCKTKYKSIKGARTHIRHMHREKDLFLYHVQNV